MQCCCTDKKKLLIGEGVLFSILGLLAIFLPVVSTFSIEILIGFLFIFGGIAQLYRTFAYHHHHFWGPLLTGILYTASGILLIIFPLAGVLSLTLLLTIFFFFDGIAKSFYAFQIHGTRHWGWLLLNGVLSLILGYLLWSGWPGTALWALGLLAGINLLFFGISLILLGSSCDSQENPPPKE